MLFGLIARVGTFAINAGLVFLLSQRVPQLDWWDANPKSTAFEGYRDRMLASLQRVRIDLETNGKLLFERPRADTPLPPALESRAEDLDRRQLRPVRVTD
ncbi:MAG TPA: hypothetical protein VGH23_00295 [Rhizomicrobium sp.]|jgi:hypothetical protein